MVAESLGKGDFVVVYYVGIYKRGESVDLVSDFVFVLGVCGCRAEERDIVILVFDARVIAWDLRWKRS